MQIVKTNATIPNSKRLGQYLTPTEVAETLVGWTVKSQNERLLDPSCGEGVFLKCHDRSVGVEIDQKSASIARIFAPRAVIYEEDFFHWAARTQDRFEIAAGNPPFIRYQQFSGDERRFASNYCASLGARFSGLSSSWALFLVAAAGLLKPNGRMAFVVPAEIAHATYARTLLEWLCAHFEHVRIVAFQEKLFPKLSEDAWFLHCQGFGGQSHCVYLEKYKRFQPNLQFSQHPQKIELSSLIAANYRLRRFLLDESFRSLYDALAARPGVMRLGEICKIGIGYVTGANDFFHLSPSEARKREIPSHLLRISVRKAQQLPPDAVNERVLREWMARDLPILLLDLASEKKMPGSVLRYLATTQAENASGTYKCRTRDPWYIVPDIKIPEAFLSYMCGVKPNLVRNESQCVCTNSIHGVIMKNGFSVHQLQTAWQHSFCELSCELEGHPLGGGMLKLEPGEAEKVRVPLSGLRLTQSEAQALQEAIVKIRRWRHYG